ncbi:MAG: tRNA (guanosine(37)-N1)-methyltransferase TrmD [Rhabdochlamydiaceae bacterium]|nr:tRNA (guanosine(37)-N1)-methyltransferase TrmD [Rhabdochlamydiaceae bacterium]
MRFDILSLFPEYFEGPFGASILKRAQEKGLIEIQLTDIRAFAEGKHRKVDDRPFGGGPGMVLMPEPMTQAIRHVKKENSHVVYLSPQGKLLNAATCQRLAECPHLILVCGHYEGLDERVIEAEIDEEISIGDYVLTNGCLASIVLVDAISRFVPGVLGHEEAAYQDSFQNGIFDGPCYTRPVVFEGRSVPEVLRQGNHAEIEKWRKRKAVEKTRLVRPDLYISEEMQ